MVHYCVINYCVCSWTTTKVNIVFTVCVSRPNAKNVRERKYFHLGGFDIMLGGFFEITIPEFVALNYAMGLCIVCI